MNESNARGVEDKRGVEADFIKCESCGGNLVFDAETQKLICEHCGAKIDFEKDREVRELDIQNAFAAAEKWNDAAVLRCENCGAALSVEREDVAIICPYCGTSHVKRTEEIAGIKPNALYPFTVTAKNAAKFAAKWARSKLFAPRRFKKNLEEKNLHGVFQPCFTFDSHTATVYSGELGRNRTRTVRTKNGTRTETYTEWFRVSGQISIFFDDVAISANKKLPQSKLDKIMPFKNENICVYEKKYLAGFVANHYDKDVRLSWNEAKAAMDERIKRAIVNRYHADVIGHLNTSTKHEGVTYKYVLLPIYMLFYSYKGKKYEVGVNGNTGKVVGKAPISPLRVIIAIALGALALVGLYFLLFRR